MATDHASPPRGGPGEKHRDVPLAEPGHPFLDEHFLPGGVGVVAGLTGTSLFRLVDMEIMKVRVPVAETGDGSGPLVHRYFAGMAVKTEGVVCTAVRQVKGLGEIP